MNHKSALYRFICLFSALFFHGIPMSATEMSINLPNKIKPWQQIYSEAKEKIPVIFSAGRLCSGARIDSDLVLTAAHCVAVLREVYLFWGQRYDQSSTAIVVAIDRKNDLALLRLNTPGVGEPFSVLTDDNNLNVADELATIGHPSSARTFEFPPFDNESTYLFSKGVISQRSEASIISDISVSPGNSGGPALNNLGQIVGVVSRKRIDPGVGNITHLIGPKIVRAFIEENKGKNDAVPVKLAESNLDLSVWYNQGMLTSAVDAWDNNNFEADLGLTIFDRLVFSHGFWVGGESKRSELFFIGWKWQRTTPNLLTGSLVSGLSSWKTESGSFATGVNFIFDHSYLPLTLKYTAAKIDQEWASIFSLGLRLF
ncbi:MAG: heat-shock protein htrA serine protease [Pseudomonadota bacterium]|jgi:hypothetical protein